MEVSDGKFSISVRAPVGALLRDVPALLRDISVLFFSKWPWRSRNSSSVYLLNSSCYRIFFLLPPQKHETRDVVVCGAGEVVEEDG